MNRKLFLLLVVILICCIAFVAFFINIRKSNLFYNSNETTQSFNTVSGEARNKHGKRARFGTHIQLCGIACYYSKPSLSGSFRFENIVEGQYTIYAQHKNCVSTPIDLIIDAHSKIALPFPMVIDQCT